MASIKRDEVQGVYSTLITTLQKECLNADGAGHTPDLQSKVVMGTSFCAIIRAKRALDKAGM
jgi:hypothetical protein